jgi:hypothetical protein
MSVLAMEIHDAGVTAVREARPAQAAAPPSPGFALLDDDEILTGLPAFRRFRLMPRRTAHRFWETLETKPLPRPFPRGLRHADLVHTHLDGIWKSVRDGVDDVILAAPGWYRDAQLGLLLGIARSCGVPVHGMVDSAVAASSTVKPGGRFIHMDLHLHRTAATALEGETVLRRGRMEVHPRLGLLELWDAWMKRVATLFVRKTRFDPLHRAETEQGLYLSLQHWLEQLLARESTRLVMEAGGKEYAIELDRKEVIDCVRPRYDEIDQLVTSLKGKEEDVTLLLSPHLCRLPGLVDLFSSRMPVIELSQNAAAAGALRAKDQVLDTGKREELAFITQLPFSIPEKEAVPALLPGETPTHILQDGTVQPITSEPFLMGDTGAVIERKADQVIVENRRDADMFVNDKKIEGPTALQTGDRVRVGKSGGEIQLVRVKE